MTNHLQSHLQLCKTWFYHLKNNTKLCPSLILGCAEKLLHTFVLFNLEYDYNSGLLTRIPSKSIQKPQHIQISTAKFLMGVTKCSYHSNPQNTPLNVRFTLYWIQGLRPSSPINVSMELPQPTTNTPHTPSAALPIRLAPWSLVLCCSSLVECPSRPPNGFADFGQIERLL